MPDPAPLMRLGWQLTASSVRIPDESLTLWSDKTLTVSRAPENGDFHLDFGSGLLFSVDRAKRIVTAPPTVSATIDHLLLDQLLPRLVADDGELVLHAALVEHPRGSLLLVGETGSGKSTLAAGFERAGLMLAGDDAAIVRIERGHALAESTYESLRLFPDSIEALGIGSRAGRPMAENSSKLQVAPRITAKNAAAPIVAILFLDAEPLQSGQVDELCPLAQAEACRLLLTQSFALDPSDTAQAQTRLAAIAELTHLAALYTLHYTRDFGELDDLCATILAELGLNDRP